MPKQWEELAPKNGVPQWKLTVTSDDPTDGVPISVFRGTKDQIAEALADSQANANRRIAELRRNNGGNGAGPGNTPPAPRPGAPKPLTAADRMTAVAELNDPATVDRAVTRIIESQVGPMENLRQATENAPADREERISRAAIAAATQFAEETPEWFPSEHNKNTLVRYMRTQGMNPTNLAHYKQAFEELTAAQLLQPKPEEEDETETQPPEPQPERNAPAPAPPKTPTRISTSVRPSQFSGQPPAKPTNRMKYSREQIAKMSAPTMKRLMTTDPEFVRCSEFYAQQDNKPKRRAS
ncbi:MAG TPA: hypothetical protein VL498_07025 [Terracidiphilus sp.]|jgi:hypothetical protein|nr:hypothetical protein [Terracidiphilus sp.]